MKVQGAPRAAATAACSQVEDFSYERLESIARTYGHAFYFFDESRFRDNFSRLKATFEERYPRTQIAYSYKTNYTPHICRVNDELGGYAEVVSEMEYEVARRLGVEGGRIIYNGPYKSAESIRDALRSGATVNLDSMRDYEILSSVAAAEPDRTFSVGARCNFEMPGIPRSRFGLDVGGAEFRQIVQGTQRSRNVRLAGLHCHFPCRDLESFALRACRMVTISLELFAEPPTFLNLGGGFCGTMPESLASIHKFKPPTFAQYAETVGDVLFKAYGGGGNAPILFIEPGTALVADTFKFYARVISLKEIDNRTVATVAGSIFNISPHARTSALPVRVIRRNGNGRPPATQGTYDIAGYTCIEGDYLTRGLSGPVDVGDFVEYGNLGSYSIVMKPPFILPNVPVLSGSCQGAEPAVIKSAETIDHIFQTFSWQ